MMKSKSSLLLAVFAGLVLFFYSACSVQNDSNIAIVHGTWEEANEEKVSLFSITHGRLEEVATFNVGEDREFSLAVPVKSETFYVVGIGNAMAHPIKFVVYLKPGDQVNMAVNNFTYSLVGENTPENKELEKWHNFMSPLEQKSFYSIFSRDISTYVDFFPLLDEKVEELETLKFGSSGNPVFEQAFAEFRKIDFMANAVGYNYMPRTAHPESEDYPEYYRNINMDEITSDCRLLAYPFGKSLLSQLFHFSQVLQEGKLTRDYAKWIKNDTLIGEMSLSQLGQLKSYGALIKFEDEFGKYILTDDQKKRLNEVRIKLAQENKEGQPAVDFTYPDINGKQVSLSDFKGKVVLIDVWATWCGPCKAQIPALKKLEADYHSNDLVVMSISIDEEKDEQKWKDFVKTEDLKGVQLYAGGWKSEIVKYYNIKGIPRFMLIDKKGNLVSVDAPRPSTPDLRKLIDAELKK
ncbi:TlpA family protein disulfide reductase [Maribellus sediminis]|uniref:TlpA family protein disulfide reductase n=1 Tax=Maribellus sediminis TaxID=2696285 RepID=UPI00142F9BEC|nr:TlpA disulfide reductase family protein [Maribellus sediminis]